MPESSNDKTGLVKLGGLWVNTDRRGNKYLQGKMTYSARFLAFPNTYKKPGSSEPDYILYVAPVDNTQGNETLESDPLANHDFSREGAANISDDLADPFADPDEQPAQPARRMPSQEEYDNRPTRREYRGGQLVDPNRRVQAHGTRR